MKTDLVSVIMPTYNTGSILTESIDSILNQTYKNLELIITDDKSDDETTLAILRSYMLKDKRVKVFFLDENKGNTSHSATATTSGFPTNSKGRSAS